MSTDLKDCLKMDAFAKSHVMPPCGTLTGNNSCPSIHVIVDTAGFQSRNELSQGQGKSRPGGTQFDAEIAEKGHLWM